MSVKLKQVGLLLALFIAGSCSNDMIEKNDNSSLIAEDNGEIDLNSLKSEFSFALARVLNESEDARELIKEEAIKQFDHDYDVLYMLVKEKQLNRGGTLEELVSEYMSKENLQALYKEMPTLTIFVPSLPEDIFSAEKWNVAQEIPCVAYKDKENQILFVDNSGKVNLLRNNEVPAFPIVVVKPSERVVLSSASTRNSGNSYVIQGGNGMNFVFEYDEFNNITPLKANTRIAEIPDKLKKAFDAKKYADLNGIWQRDYIYYDIATMNGIGAFKKNISECIYSFELVGNPNTVYKSISDQDDDPKYHDEWDGRSQGRGNQWYWWYNGNYEFVVKLYVSNNQLVSNEIIKILSISPEDLFELDLKPNGSGRNVFPTRVVGIKSYKKYYLSESEPLPLFDWNLENYSSAIKISIQEKDIETTEQRVVETTSTFATNFNFSAEYSTVVKLGAQFGVSSTKEQRVSTTVTTYLNSDELGDVIVNFGDDVVIKNEMDTIGYRTEYPRRGTRGIRGDAVKEIPICRPALNPKYNSGYYKIEIIPLAMY